MEYNLKPILHEQKHELKKAMWLVGLDASGSRDDAK